MALAWACFAVVTKLGDAETDIVGKLDDDLYHSEYWLKISQFDITVEGSYINLHIPWIRYWTLVLSRFYTFSAGVYFLIIFEDYVVYCFIVAQLHLTVEYT